MKKGSIGVLLGPDLAIELQLRWAVRLAEARQMDLLIYQQVDRQDGEIVERNLTDEADGDGAAGVREISGVIEAYPHLRAGRRETEESDDDPETIHLRCKQIPLKSLTSFRQLLLADVQKEKLPLMTAARSEMNTTDPDYIKERRLFLRFAPCEVVFCFGHTFN